VVRATVGVMPAGLVVRGWRDDFPSGLALAPASSAADSTGPQS
jgi:hypothetical protein